MNIYKLADFLLKLLGFLLVFSVGVFFLVAIWRFIFLMATGGSL